MGIITARKRGDGSVGYTAQIRKKQKGKVIFNEAQTFDRRSAAVAWIRKREGELDKPGTMARLSSPKMTLGEAID